MGAIFDPSAIIRDYLAVYERANGHSLDEALTYERGWFVFKTKSGFDHARYRRAKLQVMRQRLAKIAEARP